LFYIGAKIERFSNCGARSWFSGRGRELIVCVRDVFILNETWVQGRKYIFIGTVLGLNILLIA
jgi:hypothetical protein